MNIIVRFWFYKSTVLKTITLFAQVSFQHSFTSFMLDKFKENLTKCETKAEREFQNEDFCRQKTGSDILDFRV